LRIFYLDDDTTRRSIVTLMCSSCLRKCQQVLRLGIAHAVTVAAKLKQAREELFLARVGGFKMGQRPDDLLYAIPLIGPSNPANRSIANRNKDSHMATAPHWIKL
jgi:hypothetical protein